MNRAHAALCACLFVVALGCSHASTPPAADPAEGHAEGAAPPASAPATQAPATPAGADVRGEEVSYEVDGVKLKGYLAYDAARAGRRPGVLIVHEWWGHNDYVRRRARQLAQAGYTAFALDMYGDGKLAEHPDDAKKFMSEVLSNLPAAEARFRAARELLAAHPRTDPGKIAAIGYCFGGGIVLHMARAGADLAAVASFHGTLSTETPAQAGRVKARLLVATGADDPFVPAAQVEAFKREMDEAGVQLELVSYPGAKHAFTVPEATEKGQRMNLPLAYNEAADKDSWARLLRLLGEVFGVRAPE